jgi:hypothetical protein
MEGVFAREEFGKNGEVFRPPQIAGRYMVLNGVVLFIFHDRIRQADQTSYVGFGRYTISATAYAYGYDDFSTYAHAAAGTSVSQKLPFEGMKSFTSALEQDGMHLRSADARQDYKCSPGELLYTFGPGNYRKYRRIKSE